MGDRGRKPRDDFQKEGSGLLSPFLVPFLASRPHFSFVAVGLTVDLAIVGIVSMAPEVAIGLLG